MMSLLRKIHAAGFNFLARAFGVMAIIVGVVFTIWGLSLVLDHNATIDVDGVPTSAPKEKAMVLIIGLVAVVIGVLMLKARPYRPDGSNFSTLNQLGYGSHVQKIIPKKNLKIAGGVVFGLIALSSLLQIPQALSHAHIASDESFPRSEVILILCANVLIWGMGSFKLFRSVFKAKDKQ